MSDSPSEAGYESWTITAFADKLVIQTALLAHEAAWDWDADIVLSGGEVDEAHPQDWKLEAYLPREPSSGDRQAMADLFADKAPDFVVEQLADRDWVTVSQQNVEPIRAGRFYIHTPDFPPVNEQGVRSFAIPASQAFGTGQHRTTAGCLAMLTFMKRTGVNARNVADIGTGTGLLAFAALDLWPHATAIASDADAVCAQVVADNATSNGIVRGRRAGQLTMTIADGMNDQALQARAPYDLLIANILAGPLMDLAPDFADAVDDGGHVLLAGLLTTQEPTIRRAYRRAGFRLAKRLVAGDWSILWLRKRRNVREAGAFI